MSVNTIIKESMNKNPLGVKEALEEELKARLASKIEAKMKKEDKLEENISKYNVDTGPLMKASAWIPSSSLKKMLEKLIDEKETGNFAVGELSSNTGKTSQMIVMIHNEKPEDYFKKGMGKKHTFYYDTGNGHRQTSETITILGMVAIGRDGSIKTTGNVNMNAKTSLMVFK